MNVERMNMGDAFGRNLELYIQIGQKEILERGRCTICGGKPVLAGIVIADGSDAARKKMNTPEVENPYSHRLAFFGLCDTCKDDPQYPQKVQAKVLQAVKQNDTTPTPIVDGQTFSL